MVGDLYTLNQYHWLVYPTHASAFAAADLVGATAPAAAAHWSDQLGCDVRSLSPKTSFVVLEVRELMARVTTTNGHVGWIVVPDEPWALNSFSTEVYSSHRKKE